MTQTLKSIKLIVLSLVLALGLMAPVALTSSASAQPTGEGGISGGLGQGAQDTDPTAGDIDDAGGQVQGMVELVINIFSWVVGIISVIMIIIGGLKYITSGGDAGNVTGAKNTILYAIIGLVVVALAQIIVRFVVQQVTDPGAGL